MRIYTMMLRTFLPLFFPVICFSFVPTSIVRTQEITSTSRLLSANAASTDHSYLETVREGISEAGFQDLWDKSVEILVDDSISIDTVQAEACLAKIWRWKSWAVSTSKIARKYIKTVQPDPEQIKTSLSWLKEGPLELGNDAHLTLLREAILNYPEAYLLNPEGNLNQALSVAPQEYRTVSSLRDLLLKDPSVLQCTYNCADDGCASECGNCWVTYNLKA